MSKETKGTNVQVAQGAQNQPAAVAATATKQPATTTKAETKKPLAEELAERLQELKLKKQLADNREVFLETDEHLQAFQKDLQKQEKAGHFEAATAKIVFKGQGKNYGLDEIFAISNVVLICKFIDMLRKEIAEKVQEIETELIF